MTPRKKHITPLSADLAGHGRTRTLALQKLHRICLAEVRTLKTRYTLTTVKFRPLQVPRKMRSDQRFTYLALDQKKPAP